MKNKTITLAGPLWASDDIKAPTAYRVMKVTDSLDYSPDQTVKKSEAQELCDSPVWKVTFVPLPK